MRNLIKEIFKKFKPTFKEYNFETKGSSQVAKYTISAINEKEAWRKAEEIERAMFKNDAIVCTDLISVNDL